MPISYKLSIKENRVLRKILNLESFNKQRLNYLKQKVSTLDFKKEIDTLFEKGGINNLKKQTYLLEVAFAQPDEEVPRTYVEEQTKEIISFKTPKVISVKDFTDFKKGCYPDEYMLFRFSTKIFSLGYVRKDCNGSDCNIRWFDRNTNTNDFQEHMHNGKIIKGIIHQNNEFDILIQNSKVSIYLFRREYVNPAAHNSIQTIVLSNTATIKASNTFDNKGGNCCPPQI